MSTIVNMLVLSIQIFPVPTTMNNLVASSLLNNIVGSTMLLTHEGNNPLTTWDIFIRVYYATDTETSC